MVPNTWDSADHGRVVVRQMFTHVPGRELMSSLSAVALLLTVATFGQAPPAGETVLLDFTADWCGPCQSVRPLVEHLAGAGYPVRQVNVDRHRALAAQYRVSSIPCFVMLVNGVEVDREVGPASQQRLVQMLSRAQQATAASAPGQALPRMQAQSPDNGSSRTFAASSTASQPASHNQAMEQTLSAANAGDLIALLTKASVRLRVDDPKGHSFGTGTIIDRRGDEALVLTCGHLFRDSDGKGTIWVELLDGSGAKPLQGQLISFDLNRDLGLVSIRPQTEVAVATVASAQHAVGKGQKVISVGCNNGQAPSVLRSQVTNIDRYAGPRNIQVSGTPVEGRSGGGLFDESGHLIGVCFAADPSDNEGVYAHLESIQTELTRLGLGDVVAKDSSRSIPTVTPAAQFATSEPPSMPMQMPKHDSAIALTSGSSPAPVVLSEASARHPAELAATAEAARSALDRMSAAERATLEELKERVQDAEVICIVRPLNDPNAKSEIIVLNQASPLFVEQISRAAQVRRPTNLTSHSVPTGIYPTTARRPLGSQELEDAQGWKAKR